MTEPIFEPYTVSMTFQSQTSKTAEAWARLLCEFLNDMARHIVDSGSVMIGHLKGMAQAPDSGYFKISTIGADHAADVSGDLNWSSEILTLSLTLLVYGLPAAALADLTRMRAGIGDKPWSGLVTLA